MPDSISTTGERTVVVHRFGVLTYLSLALNGLILLLMLIGFVARHHAMERARAGGEEMDHHAWADRGHGDREGDFHHDERGMPGWRHRGYEGEDDQGNNGSCEVGSGDRHLDHDGSRWEGGERADWGGGRAGFGGPSGGEFQDRDDHSMPQTPPSSEAMTDRFMLMLTEKLALTDQESAQIRPVVQGGITQLQKDMQTQQAAHQKMLDDDRAKVRAVLTPDQQKQFDEMTEDFGGRAGTPASPAPASK